MIRQSAPAIRALINLATMRRGGAVTHAAAFMPELIRLRPDIEFTVLVPEDHHEAVSTWGAQVATHQLRASSPMLRLTLDQWSVRRLARQHDVVLSMLNHGPFALSQPHIVWARNALYFEPGQRAVTRLNSWFAMRTMASADLVVFPSITTRRAAELAGFRNEGIVLRHPFRAPLPEQDTLRSQGPDESMRILVPTSAQPHKNLELIPRVSAALRTLGVEHRFDVSVRPDEIAETSHIRAIDRYEAADIASLRSEYQVVLLPSRCESFSYPLLEFEELGFPVAASDIGAHRELADRAHLFDPFDPQAAAEALLAALKSPKPIGRNPAGTARFNDPTSYAELVARQIDALVGRRNREHDTRHGEPLAGVTAALRDHREQTSTELSDRATPRRLPLQTD